MPLNLSITTNFRLFHTERVSNLSNFKFDGNGRTFSKSVENNVGNEEIARDKQFLRSHSVFKRLPQQTRRNKGLSWKGFNQLKCALIGNLNSAGEGIYRL